MSIPYKEELSIMNNLEKVVNYLDQAGVFFVTTTDGDQPKCRPFSFKIAYDGKLYFGEGTLKEVYLQMQ